MRQHSEKFLRQRKFFMVLPLLVLPFITLLFWALGGGQGTPAQAHKSEYSGLNLELPGAIFTKEDENWNKFDLYEKAKRDSLKFQRARQNDPYYEVTPLLSLDQGENENLMLEAISKGPGKSNLNTSLERKTYEIDPNEAKVNQKLEQLYKELESGSSNPVEKEPGIATLPGYNLDDPIEPEIDRLEAMMLMMREDKGEDPEMQQIENVLEKILDIQYPDRVKERMKEKSLRHNEEAFPVEKQTDEDDISLLTHTSVNHVMASTIPSTQSRFYGLEDELTDKREPGNAIEAVIHDTQELMNGSTVKMRLLNDVYVNGNLISKDQFIFGMCAINGERLTIDIESIRTENSLFPVSMSAYDLDGMEGVYIPGAIARDVAKQSTNQSIQGMEFLSLDPSVSAQAANAGIQAAKTFLSKKAKAIKVTVKAGYKVLLKDANAQP